MPVPSFLRDRRLSSTIVLALAEVALFAVLVPVHAAVYGTFVPTAFLAGALACGAPLVALARPRLGIGLFAAAAFLLPVVSSPDREPRAPWPWSVPALIAVVVLVVVVTLAHGWRLGLYAYLLSIAASLVALPALVLSPPSAVDDAVTGVVVATSVTGGLYVVAVLYVGRQRIRAELTREREATASEQARRRMVEERTRIARELHDVVAHSMSLIQVQASTARYRLPGLPETATAEFDDIATTARGALTEMRRLLGVLRTEDQTAERAPQQGIADIPALVENVRRAGVDIVLERSGSGSREPQRAVQIAAFRIVQEAVSNAVRHAPGAAVVVSVSEDAAAVLLRVRNSAPPVAPARRGSEGHGVRGMRERAELLGGSISCGPDADGGWTVTASLPLDGEPADREEEP